MTDQVDNDNQPNTDLYDSGLDPAMLARLRVAEPQMAVSEITACPIFHDADGRVIAGSAASVDALTRNREVRASGALGNTGGAARPLIPLDLDGPEHTSYRKLLDPIFTPRKMALLEDDIRELADQLIDTFAERGEADLYDEFCAILPATIFLRIMGIPAEDLDYFLAFKNDVLRDIPGETLDDRAVRFFDAAIRCYDYFNKALDQREGLDEPTDDLLGRFMSAEVDGHKLSREEILDVCYLLMIAGLDTVAASLSCILSWFARHPDERKRVVADPEMWPHAIEELLRWETPVPVGSRTPQVDMVVGGETIAAGTHVGISWQAANLDPANFEDPLTVDLERHPNPHYTFAAGFHRCLGSHLARMELRAALDQFHRRIPDYEIAPGVELQYEAMPVRLVKPLPIVWTAR